MLKTTAMLLNELSEYVNPEAKIRRDVRDGKIFPVVRGLYETDKDTPGYLLAGAIYGPSYLSFEYALSHYGFIPERVYAYTSATYGKKKKKLHKTDFGVFLYRDVPECIYPEGLRLEREGDRYYQIASPEKALCDKMYDMPPVGNIKEITALMLEDLRIDEGMLGELDMELLSSISDRYPSKNVKLMSKALRKMRKI